MKSIKKPSVVKVRVLLSLCSLIMLMCLILFTSNSSALAKTNSYVNDGNTNPSWNFLGCGTGWNPLFYVNYTVKYAYTTGSQACSEAVWDDHQFSQNKSCYVFVLIPEYFATARIAYGLYGSHGLIERDVINQKAVSGFVLLKQTPVFGINHILISSNNGEIGTYMAAGPVQFDCQ